MCLFLVFLKRIFEQENYFLFSVETGRKQKTKPSLCWSTSLYHADMQNKLASSSGKDVISQGDGM